MKKFLLGIVLVVVPLVMEDIKQQAPKGWTVSLLIAIYTWFSEPIGWPRRVGFVCILLLIVVIASSVWLSTHPAKKSIPIELTQDEAKVLKLIADCYEIFGTYCTYKELKHSLKDFDLVRIDATADNLVNKGLIHCIDPAHLKDDCLYELTELGRKYILDPLKPLN